MREVAAILLAAFIVFCVDNYTQCPCDYCLTRCPCDLCLEE